LNLFPLAAVVFFIVCGGAYGIEPLVGALGAGWAVVLIVITPLIWAVPVSLMVAELSSMMPEEGGYYVWVRTALGDFWGVQQGWWTVGYTAIDLAIYPVLFVNYLAYFFPYLAFDENGSATTAVFATRWLIATLIILAALLLNWQGAKAVGRNSVVNLVIVLGPFVVLTVVGFWHKGATSEIAHAIMGGIRSNSNAGLLSVGLATAMWNYTGWDNSSTFAGEVNSAGRSYPRALAAALTLSMFAYLLPVLAGLTVTVDSAHWSESAGWPVIAELMGGPWLGFVIAAAALFSAWSLFNSCLLYVSRLPYAMACDGWLPRFMTKISPRSSVPIGALLVTCALASSFSAVSFNKLVVMDVALSLAALLLEFLALILLRIKQPQVERPFKIPGGWIGLAWVTLTPMFCGSLLLYATLTDETAITYQMLVLTAIVVSGPCLFAFRRNRSKTVCD
jgi:amino acid transporter